MPKLLPRYTGPDAETKTWVRALIRREMSWRGLSFRELAGLLTAVGLAENEGNLRSKVARGELSAALLLAVLHVMECKSINVGEFSLSTDPPPEDVLTVDAALHHPLVHVTSRDDREGRYELQIGKLRTPIHIRMESRIMVPITGGGVYSLSHFVRVSDDERSSPPSCAGYDVTLARCVRRAVIRLTKPYAEALESGLRPSENWVRQCPRWGSGA